MQEISTLTSSQPLGENPASQCKEEKMKWTCFEDNRNPGDWRVEAIDFEDEGKVYVAIFSGPDAQTRAEEYAELKNSAQHLQAA